MAALGLGIAAIAQVPTHAPERVPDDVHLEIDGRLSESFWLTAVPIADFTEVEPIDGAQPAVETLVRVGFDRDFIYVGIECRDEPGLVRARLMERDARLDPDDRVELWFDTFDDQRFAYWFQIGAGGSRGDALMSDGGRVFNKSWDGIWHGAAIVGVRGWTAELAIPFKTLAFNPDQDTWGFNVRRLRKEHDEEFRWAAPSVAYRFFDLTEGGRLTGLHGMAQGVGLDLIPYAKVSGGDRPEEDPTSRGDFGGDLRYRITPALGLQLTYNTDFAETEVDERKVNLSRFPLFFPEKRDFFLEDAGLFEFGAPERRTDTVPYFSRTIGRSSSGDPVPIVLGARVAGHVDDWSVGLLEVVLDGHDDLEERGLGVVRVARNLGNGGSAGLIYTGGRPNGEGYASTMGADLVLNDPRAFGDGRGGSLYGYVMGTQVDGPGGEGASYGLQAEYRSADWQHTATFNHVDDEFRPELGFVARQGIRRYRWDARYTWRAAEVGLIRRATWRLSPTLTTSDTNEMDSWAVPWRWFELVFGSEDSIQLETHQIFERIDEQFALRGVPVLPGDYPQTRHFATARSSERRSIFGDVRPEFGDFYDGELLRAGASVSGLPSRYAQLTGSYDEYHVDLSTGSFVTRVAEGRIDITPSPWLAWRNLAQYDTDSRQLALQSRVRWILEPGKEVFVVGLFGWERPDDDTVPLRSTGQDLALKLVYTVRF